MNMGKLEQRHTRMYVIHPVQNGHQNLNHLIVQQFRSEVPIAVIQIFVTLVVLRVLMDTPLKKTLIVWGMEMESVVKIIIQIPVGVGD